MSNCRVLQSGTCLITQPFHYAGDKGYDYYHGGVDLVDFSQGYSTLGYIVAHSAGKVVAIETGYTGQVLDGSYGNYVMLMHANGYRTVYAHLAYGTIRVSLGQWVEKGQVIAYMDNTGHSFGGHLHFEVRNQNNERIDPEPYLNASLPSMEGSVQYINGQWVYIVCGSIDYSYNGVAERKDNHTWWKIKGGYVDFSYTGLAKNEHGWWMCVNGQVMFSYNGIVKNEYGWWKVTNGKVDFSFTGIAKNENGWWYLENGKVDFDYNGLAKRTDNSTWWMIQAGAVDFDFNGIVCNEYGFWVVQDGQVNFGYNGEYKFSGVTYPVKEGKVIGS
jgi:hypothetical protein